MRALFCFAVTLALVAGPVDAQVCTGSAPFSSGRMSIGGEAAFTDGAQAYGGSVGFGAAEGGFGSLHAGAITYEDLDGSTFLVGARAGYSLSLGVTRSFEVCPLATLAFGFGPNDIAGFGVDMSTRDFQFGFGIGTMLAASPAVSLVPAAGVSYSHSRLTFDDGTESETESESFGIASFALGFVMNRTFTIQPNISMAFGIDERDPVYGIAFSLHLGNR